MEDNIIMTQEQENTQLEQPEINSEENAEVQSEQPITPKIFDPDEVNFEGDYQFSGYDLSKFKEDISLDENSTQVLETFSKKFGELGLSQEQAEGVIEMLVSQEAAIQTPEAIVQNLNKNLTYEEKRAYKANCNILKQALQGTEHEELYNTLVSDSVAVKILSKVINHMKGGMNVNRARTEKETRTKEYMTGSQAVDVFNKFLLENIGKGADLKSKAKEMLGMLATEEDRKYFNSIINLENL